MNRLVQDGRDLSTEVQKIHKYQVAYRRLIEEYKAAGALPVYDAGFISLDKQFLTLGVNGLAEAAEFLGIEVGNNPKYKDFAEKFKNNQLDFKNLPLEQIIEDKTTEIDPAKADTIKSMIMETNQEMFDLDIAADDYETKMKELQTFAVKDINIDLDNFMNSSMSKEDFMGITKLVRDGIINKKIGDISGQITEDVTDQVMQDNAVQIQNIREQMESDIKDDLDFDKQVEGIDPEIVEAVEQQVETQVQNEVRDQIEQTITETIQNNITTNFVDLNSSGGNINSQAIQDMTNTIKDQIASQFGSNYGGFFGGFRSRSKIK